MSKSVTVAVDDLEALIKSFAHTYLKPEMTIIVGRLEQAILNAKKEVVIAG